MDMLKTFQKVILPYLCGVIERSGAREGIFSISLYGSANYSSYRDVLPPRSSSEEQDYDIWIIFKRGYANEAKKLATVLFGASFMAVKETDTFILYDKVRWISLQGEFLLAPIIAMENSYDLLQGVGSEPILIPWYRPKERGRSPVVPVRNAYSEWRNFDMRQRYLPDINLWQLMMPLALPMPEGLGLGTFIEGSITGRLLYGDVRAHNQVLKRLMTWFVAEAKLDAGKDTREISELLYEMLTISSKAGKNFRSYKLQEISDWISK